MFTKFKETIDNLYQDFKDSLPTSLRASQDKVDHVINCMAKRIECVKERVGNRLNQLNKEIKDLEVNSSISIDLKNQMIKEKQDQKFLLEEQGNKEIELLYKERDDELLKIADEDEKEIERLKKQRDEEIARLNKENEEHIDKFQKEFELQVEKARKDNQESIEKLSKEKEEQINKLWQEFGKLREQYKPPVV